MAARNGVINEVYNVLTQIQNGYENLMGVVSSLAEAQQKQADMLSQIHDFVYGQFTDAVTARDVWRKNAEIHKAEIERLRGLLAQYEKGAVLATPPYDE